MDKTKKQWEVMALNALLILFTNFAIFLSVPPQTKIFEDIICRKMQWDSALNLHPGDDDRCRAALVQSELARINGWKTTFEALPSRLSLMNHQFQPLVDPVFEQASYYL
jgi:hypothetical protein